MKKHDEPVVIEQTFSATAEAVWEAITQIGQMRQWYFENIPSFEPKVGFETQFNVTNEGRNFLHLWRVTEVEPMKRLAYDWKFDGYAGDSLVLFELFEKGGSTLLRVTATVRESFTENIPEFRRESCVGGWEFFIQQRLKEYLEPV